MYSASVNRNTVVFGVADRFGEEIVNGLIDAENDIILCGDYNLHIQRLLEMNPRQIPGFCNWNKSAWLKRIQVQVELFGSLDVFIYLLYAKSGKIVCQQPDHISSAIYSTSLVAPINTFKALLPYLNKCSGCKVVFLDINTLTANSSQLLHYDSELRYLSGYCQEIATDMSTRNIDIETLFSARQLLESRLESESIAGLSPRSWYRSLAGRSNNALQLAGPTDRTLETVDLDRG